MSRRDFVPKVAKNRRTADTKPVFVDSITQAVDVLWIYLRKTINNVKLVPAQGKSNIFGKHPVLQPKGFERHFHRMKRESFQRFVAVGENMDFMANIS